MIKHTEGEWTLRNPDILDIGVNENYFYIEAGVGFFDKDNPRGFAATAFMQRGDAVLLANAKKMYDMLQKITNAAHESTLIAACNEADTLLEEMEAQANEES